MEVLIIMAIFCSIIGAAIDGVRGAALGFLLGIFGLLITAILKGK